MACLMQIHYATQCRLFKLDPILVGPGENSLTEIYGNSFSEKMF